jgi:PAS domain S-box-containing protein
MDDIVFEFDSNHTYLNIWTADENLLIKPRNDLLNKRLNETFYTELSNLFISASNQAVTTGKNVIIEFKILKQGNIRWSQAKVLATKNALNERRYIVTIRDITERKQAELNLQKRLDYEQLLNKISLMAINSDDNVEKFQNDCLQVMGETLKVSRVYIFEYQQETDTISNSYEWVASGISAEKKNLQGIPANISPWWAQMMENNQIINFQDIEDISDEKIKKILRPQKIKSLLVVPLFFNQTLYGFLGFDECKNYRIWPQEDVNFLLSISRLITQVLSRQRVEEELQNERLQLRSIFDSINEPVYVADMDNYKILYVNKALQDFFGKELIGETCYKVFQEKDNPCEFCTNNIIKELNYQPHLWDHYNPVIKRDLQAIERVIRWPDGRDVRFQLAIDITERKLVEKA